MLSKVAKNRSVRAFLLTFTVFSTGLFCGNAAMVHAADQSEEAYEGLGTFARALTQIQTHYVEELSTPRLAQAAIKGMADSLDPRTNYFDPETYRRLRQDTEGNQSGVGVLVNPADEGGLVVTELVPGGPAELAGVQVGDLVIEVDGHDIRGLDLSEAVALVRGPRGSAVTLGVLRAGQRQVIEVVRDEILQPSVSAELVEPGVGYLRIEQFRRRSGQEFLDELKHLEAMDGGSLDALVLDLRNNPGGLLEQAVVVVTTSSPRGSSSRPRGARARPATTASRPPRWTPISRPDWWCSSTACRPRPPRSWPARCRTTDGRCWWGSPATARARSRPTSSTRTRARWR